jgi:hypothetical protein
MQDLKARIKKLLMGAEECDLIAKRATTDVQKRALFEKLARDYREMAEDIGKIIAIRENGPN